VRLVDTSDKNIKLYRRNIKYVCKENLILIDEFLSIMFVFYVLLTVHLDIFM